MRKPRCVQLNQIGGLVHEYWQMHNRQFKLESTGIKSVLFACLKFGLHHRTMSKSKIAIQALCFMDNHCHKLVAYSGPSAHLSRFMKLMNGEFARTFHSIFKTSGAVTNGRPKTKPLTANTQDDIRTHLYIEANPIRTGGWKLENIHLYQFNSYRRYAYGVIDEITRILTPPRWYIGLGKTDEERQRRYRSLFRKFCLEECGLTRADIVTRVAETLASTRWSNPSTSNKIHNAILLAFKRLDRRLGASSIKSEGEARKLSH